MHLSVGRRNNAHALELRVRKQKENEQIGVGLLPITGTKKITPILKAIDLRSGIGVVATKAVGNIGEPQSTHPTMYEYAQARQLR